MIKRFGEFTIRKFRAEDFEPLAELFREVYMQTYPDFEERSFHAQRFRKILRELVLPNAEVWTVKKDSETAGFLALAPNFVDQLYIRDSFQGLSLGGFLIEQAKLIYPEFLELYTFASNEKAIAFYEKHGFCIIERGIAPDEKMPDVRMRWEKEA